MHDLIASWQDRLQLISLITTFFATAEITFLGITTPDDPNNVPSVRQTTNACFTGAVVFHTFSATISFFGTFFLVGYKLKEAKQEQKEEETKTEPDSADSPNSPKGPGNKATSQVTDKKIAESPKPIGEKEQEEGKAGFGLKPPGPTPVASKRHSSASSLLEPFSSNPRMVQTYFRNKPPVHLLDRLHAVSTWSALNGFILAFVGIVTYSWAWHARSIAIFTSTCLAACLVLAVVFISTGSYIIDEDDE